MESWTDFAYRIILPFYRCVLSIDLWRLQDDSPDANSSSYEDFHERLPLILATNDDKDIFNMDEMALICRALLNKSFGILKCG